MPFRSFTEKEVRNAIIKKASPIIQNRKAAHWRGKIYVDDTFYGTVKIPNPHKKNFGQRKAKNVANQLGLNQDQYNEFVDCTLSKKGYLAIISTEESDE